MSFWMINPNQTLEIFREIIFAQRIYYPYVHKPTCFDLILIIKCNFVQTRLSNYDVYLFLFCHLNNKKNTFHDYHLYLFKPIFDL